MLDKKSQELCTSQLECGTIALERNRYFTGKYMTAREFWIDQKYFLSRHRLHNRLLHGWGIVCGLQVKPHPREECADRWVIVTPGIAIDCCGREIILKEDKTIKVWTPPESDDDQNAEDKAEMDTKADSADLQKVDEKRGHQHEDPSQSAQPPEDDSKGTSQTGPFLLYIRYSEEEFEYVPALYAEGMCDPTRREANRLREMGELGVCLLDEVEPGCWSVPGGVEETPCIDDCDETLIGYGLGCIIPNCPCGLIVPLAVVQPVENEEGYFIGPDQIDMRGRHYLKIPSEILTQIVGINWPHGGELSLSRLRDDCNGRLEIRFDRKLEQSHNIGAGVNQYTFIVQYAGVQRDLEFLAWDPNNPPQVEEGCRAVYTIHQDYLGDVTNIANNMIYVTLKCDFILDCHGNPVDGNHLKGLLPSGNGVPGGNFVSWFKVVPDSKTMEEAK
jgi:hypothetical protein